MKLIVGAQPLQADGWSAQYPGSTSTRPAPNVIMSCKEMPCLFNVTGDPSEENDLANEMPDLASKLMDRYKELASAMAIDDTEADDKLKDLVWNGAYHVPRTADKEACEMMRRTGFWMPWKNHSNFKEKLPFSDFVHDGPASRFDEETILV
mmetsp:Transcript_18595/g.28109  ORF Transcript_18595/g.28109 Transcript_18595/m.28109 type:complete len:151 (+) Transcript_18595:1-453(+)